MTQASDLSGVSKFQRLEQRVEEQEARAEALAELDTDTVEAKLQQLEQEEKVERQLQDLKLALGAKGETRLDLPA